jgi:hypothetical protein
MRDHQNWILEMLKAGHRWKFLYWFADNITRANYADFLWPSQPISFRAHFMFHTPKINNGFHDGEHMTARHSYFNARHCCWCGNERECANIRSAGSPS